MWPFKIKEKTPVNPQWYWEAYCELVKKLSAGSTFQYLKVEMTLVEWDWHIGKGVYEIPSWPVLRAEYVSKDGVVHQHEFQPEMFSALLKMNPA